MILVDAFVTVFKHLLQSTHQIFTVSHEADVSNSQLRKLKLGDTCPGWQLVVRARNQTPVSLHLQPIKGLLLAVTHLVFLSTISHLIYTKSVSTCYSHFLENSLRRVKKFYFAILSGFCFLNK